MPDRPLVDPHTNPHLTGRFAPIHREITADHLHVEGTLPSELVGAYLRNGPNPKWPPLGSYTFPMEGDAMVHGVWFDGEGGARYRNRWVRTQGMAAEDRAGKALFGGLMTPAFVDPSTLGPDPDPGWPFRLDPMINVVRHAGRWLTFSEGVPAYEITGDLETVGRFDFDGQVPSMCAHPRIDPRTGEMVMFTYDVQAPFLSWMVIGPEGTVTRPPTPVEGVDAAHMVHDCTITERYLIITLAPVILDAEAIVRGGEVLTWQPELGTKVACIPRDGGPVQMVEHEPYFLWHYGGAYDDGDDVVVDFSWWNRFALTPVPGQHGGFARATIHPEKGSLDLELFDQVGSEFARIDDRRTGLPHRYVTVSRRATGHSFPTGEFDQLCRYDLHTGEAVSWDADGFTFGEAVFAPRPGGTDELDGWYLTFGTDLAAEHSWVMVWDAASFPSAPVARVHIPQRVPHGLHGGFHPST